MSENGSLTPKKGGTARGAEGSKQAAEWTERVLARADDAAAVVLAAGALLTLLGLLELTRGSLVDAWVGLLRSGLGWVAWGIPIALAAFAAWLSLRSRGHVAHVAWGKVISGEIAAAALLGLLAIADGMSLPRAEAGSGGGVIGWGLARLLQDSLGVYGAPLLLTVVAILCSLPSARGLAGRLRRGERALVTWLEGGEAPAAPGAAPAVMSPAAPAQQSDLRSARRLPRAFRKSFTLPETVDERAARSAPRDERLPPLELLESGETARITAREVNLIAGLIEKTLADFGLPAKVVDFRAGPAVTQFAVEPGFLEHAGPDDEVRRQKVRVSQISALASDLALALSAPTIRIEAPVPGQAYVGIEVPNRRPAMVRLRPILESDTFQSIGSPLAIALGRDVAGAPVAADLAAMPHLLIAGTTGSGKSVCITALTTCLVTNNSPEDLRLVLIDPKMVELVRFNGLPHLLGKVETELERIVGVLRWCTVEMDRRYRLLEEAKARDLEAYNRKARRTRALERLARIVVMIDELADLMMMAPDQTERTLVRLAQMARATGIHLVVATQRPSTDIVTGLIKANFPARISFAVASSIDSRVILDGAGAETLLGRGDMLFLSPEAAAPARLQGAFVSDQEIERLVDYWKQETAEAGPEAEPARAPWEELLSRQADLGERDEILERAVELVKQTGMASASMLQRRLRIGYPRAARLMDELEELGVVGRSQSGGRTREVLVGDEEEEAAPDDEEEDEAD
jgi:S-DNA-T family DNA segregation ATPase FtsK/SpoIIIE